MSRETPTDFVDARPIDETGRRLLNAAAYIETNGWWRAGQMMNSGSMRSLCMMLAIDRVCDGSTAHRDEAERRILHQIGVPNVNGAFAWNDNPARTKDEVLNALTQAAFFNPPKAGLPS